MDIRPAGPDDLPEVVALIRELAAFEELEHEVVLDEAEVGRHLFGERPSASVLLARDGPAVLGFALWYPTFSTFLGRPGIWLEDLFVRPEARGRGVGRALVEGLRRRTDGRLEWAVLDWNARAIAFYEELGARPVAGWTRYRLHQPPDGAPTRR